MQSVLYIRDQGTVVSNYSCTSPCFPFNLIYEHFFKSRRHCNSVLYIKYQISCIPRVENEIFHTRLLKPRAYGLWLNSANSCEIFHFQLVVYTIFFRRPQKKNANIRYSFKLQILFDRAADKTYIGGHGYYNCVQ
jgi:hypothetical protein